MSGNDTSDLFDYLRKYHRITLNDACKRFLVAGEVSIGIWVNGGKGWGHDTQAEHKLQQLDFKGNQSVCASIVTQLYGLSRLQYEKISASFEEERWQSWAGVYEANEAQQRPKFVLVVKLPPKASAVGRVGAGGIGGALGTLAGVGLMTWSKNKELDQKTVALTTAPQGKLDLCESQSTKCSSEKKSLEKTNDTLTKSSNDNYSSLQRSRIDHAATTQTLRKLTKDVLDNMDLLEPALDSQSNSQFAERTPKIKSAQGIREKNRVRIDSNAKLPDTDALNFMRREFKEDKWGFAEEQFTTEEQISALKDVLLNYVQLCRTGGEEESLKGEQKDEERAVQNAKKEADVDEDKKRVDVVVGTIKDGSELVPFYNEVTLEYWKKLCKKASHTLRQCEAYSNTISQQGEKIETLKGTTAENTQRLTKIQTNFNLITENLAARVRERHAAEPDYDQRKTNFDAQFAAINKQASAFSADEGTRHNGYIGLNPRMIVDDYQQGYKSDVHNPWGLLGSRKNVSEEILREQLGEYLFAIRRASEKEPDVNGLWNSVQLELNEVVDTILSAGESAQNGAAKNLAQLAALDDYYTCITSQYYIDMLADGPSAQECQQIGAERQESKEDPEQSSVQEVQKLKTELTQVDTRLRDIVRHKIETSLKDYDQIKNKFDAQFVQRNEKLADPFSNHSTDNQKEIEKALYAPMLAQFYQGQYNEAKWNLDKRFIAENLSKYLSLYLFTLRRFENGEKNLDSVWGVVQKEVGEMVTKIMGAGEGLVQDQKLQAQLSALDTYYNSITRDYHLKMLARIFPKKKMSKIFRILKIFPTQNGVFL